MVKRVAVGGLEMEYEEVGLGGRPFVLVHGLGGSRDDFADVLEALSARGRTLALDQRGHGGTSNPGSGYTLDQLTADLAGFLDATGVGRCDLLGHSLGGMVALRLALAEPERLASLTLMDTTARSVQPMPRWMLRSIGWFSRHAPPGWIWRLLRANRRRLSEPMRRAEREMGPERYWTRLRAKLEALDSVAFGELLRAAIDQEPLIERLYEIRCPTLVLVGEQDAALLEPGRELAEHIPDAELVVVEGSHHSPQIEARAAFLDAVGAHLERARS